MSPCWSRTGSPCTTPKQAPNKASCRLMSRTKDCNTCNCKIASSIATGTKRKVTQTVRPNVECQLTLTAFGTALDHPQTRYENATVQKTAGNAETEPFANNHEASGSPSAPPRSGNAAPPGVRLTSRLRNPDIVLCARPLRAPQSRERASALARAPLVLASKAVARSCRDSATYLPSLAMRRISGPAFAPSSPPPDTCATVKPLTVADHPQTPREKRPRRSLVPLARHLPIQDSRHRVAVLHPHQVLCSNSL